MDFTYYKNSIDCKEVKPVVPKSVTFNAEYAENAEKIIKPGVRLVT